MAVAALASVSNSTNAKPLMRPSLASAAAGARGSVIDLIEPHGANAARNASSVHEKAKLRTIRRALLEESSLAPT